MLKGGDRCQVSLLYWQHHAMFLCMRLMSNSIDVSEPQSAAEEKDTGAVALCVVSGSSLWFSENLNACDRNMLDFISVMSIVVFHACVYALMWS